MENSRRKILKSLLAAGLIANPAVKLFSETVPDSFSIDFFNQESIIEKISTAKQPKILPKGLKKGAKVAVTAPASHASIWELRSFMKTMSNLGIEVVICDTIKNYNVKTRYLAADDEVRAEELMYFYKREDIDAIIPCRGGYGVMRILNLLDFQEICRNPKILIGFSDITALLNSIYHLCNIVTYHGPAGISTFNIFSLQSFKDTLFYNPEFKPIIYKDSRLKKIVGGIAEGELVGGNLTMLTSTLGSDYEIQTENKIVFIEEVSEDPYKIDRMLTQLYISKKFEQCKGIIYGYCDNLDRKYYFYPNRSYTTREVLESRFKQIGVPAIIGAPIGHILDKWTFPIGVNAELDADNLQIKILEQSVRE
jgi:muramoyltetrapeptide carboxypeptidase